MTLLTGGTLYLLIKLKQLNLIINAGDFALIIGLSIDLGWSLCSISDQTNFLVSDLGRAKQSFNELFTPLEIIDNLNYDELFVSDGRIEFSKVHFDYKGINPLPVNKSIVIQPGHNVGLVGCPGGGKTTFVNLILRFYEVTWGIITIDGQNVQNVTLSSLRESISMVAQDPGLFNRSICDNILYGNLTATEEKIINAASLAHAHESIIKLSQQYDTLISDRGAKLSGGQKQRIAIARAMLKNATILILDEATSHLDSIKSIKFRNP